MNLFELDHMQQIGLAAAKYYDQTGHYPLSIDELYRADLIAADICKSPVDPFPDGIANEYCKQFSATRPEFKALVTDYPRTYVGPGDFGYKESHFVDLILPYPGAGWLVSLTECKPRRGDTSIIGVSLQGPCARLLLDGSVVSRTQRTRVTENNEVHWDTVSMFIDEP